MDKIYQVFHVYDVDGGFGDAVMRQDIIATFECYEDAKAFVDRFSKPHVYDKPYAKLSCGELVIYESDVVGKGAIDLDNENTNSFWWLHNEVLN